MSVFLVFQIDKNEFWCCSRAFRDDRMVRKRKLWSQHGERGSSRQSGLLCLTRRSWIDWCLWSHQRDLSHVASFVTSGVVSLHGLTAVGRWKPCACWSGTTFYLTILLPGTAALTPSCLGVTAAVRLKKRGIVSSWDPLWRLWRSQWRKCCSSWMGWWHLVWNRQSFDMFPWKMHRLCSGVRGCARRDRTTFLRQSSCGPSACQMVLHVGFSDPLMFPWPSCLDCIPGPLSSFESVVCRMSSIVTWTSIPFWEATKHCTGLSWFETIGQSPAEWLLWVWCTCLHRHICIETYAYISDSLMCMMHLSLCIYIYIDYVWCWYLQPYTWNRCASVTSSSIAGNNILELTQD